MIFKDGWYKLPHGRVFHFFKDGVAVGGCYSDEQSFTSKSIKRAKFSNIKEFCKVCLEAEFEIKVVQHDKTREN